MGSMMTLAFLSIGEALMTTHTGLSEREQREQLCYLTTTGRVTGRQHEIEIWFAADPDDSARLYILSGGRDRADWVRNVRRTPAVRVRVDGRVHAGVARWVDESSTEDRHAREIVATKYQERDGDTLSEWARTSLPVAIELVGVAE